jgi:hypothetical protein|tara:strand:+ start:299 stop:436 length:138 start_codon:yes stop_codon:yes gene_type:complete
MIKQCQADSKVGKIRLGLIRLLPQPEDGIKHQERTSTSTKEQKRE